MAVSSHASLNLLDCDQSRRADKASGIDGFLLMERAGLLAARHIIAHYTPQPVSVLAGMGNNGGDGFVVARHLREAGFQPDVFMLGEPAAPEAQQAAELWTGRRTLLRESAFALEAPLIIDALFGAGLSRSLEGVSAELAEKSTTHKVVALDMPSGVSGDDGSITGTAFHAERTIAFAAARPGHLLFPGRQHCGALAVVDIGIPASALTETADTAPHCYWNRPSLWRGCWPQPAPEGHKYQRGHLLVVGGGLARAGASRMAASTGLISGVGAVSLLAPKDALASHAAAGAGIMLEALEGVDSLSASLSDRRKNVVLLGPGLGRGNATCELVLAALASSASLVLDADALTSFSDTPDILFDAVKAREAPVVMTPHEGEYRALFGEGGGSKLLRAREAAARSGALVLLKGADTVLSTPSGRAAIADNAPPWLAIAGAGDVLAGLAAGLMAQSMPVFEASAAAVWLHGEAAREMPAGLTAEALPRLIAALLPLSYDTHS